MQTVEPDGEWDFAHDHGLNVVERDLKTGNGGTEGSIRQCSALLRSMPDGYARRDGRPVVGSIEAASRAWSRLVDST